MARNWNSWVFFLDVLAVIYSGGTITALRSCPIMYMKDCYTNILTHYSSHPFWTATSALNFSFLKSVWSKETNRCYLSSKPLLSSYFNLPIVGYTVTGDCSHSSIYRQILNNTKEGKEILLEDCKNLFWVSSEARRSLNKDDGLPFQWNSMRTCKAKQA